MLPLSGFHHHQGYYPKGATKEDTVLSKTIITKPITSDWMKLDGAKRIQFQDGCVKIVVCILVIATRSAIYVLTTNPSEICGISLLHQLNLFDINMNL